VKTLKRRLPALAATAVLLLAGGSIAAAKPDPAGNGSKGKSASAHDATNPAGKTRGWSKNGGGNGNGQGSHGKADSAHSNTNPQGKLRGWDPNHPHDDEAGEEVDED
jgi:hypothetical protein